MDWKALLRGAAAQAAPLLEDSGPRAALAAHPAWKLAVWNRELMERGYDELIFFSYIPLCIFFGDSSSPHIDARPLHDGQRTMPVPAVGVTDQHSVNQMFLDGPRNKACLFLTCGGLDKGPAFGPDVPSKWSWVADKRFGDLLQAEGLGTRMALTANHVPLVNISMGSATEEAAGRLMGLCMTATILTGWLLDINPIDQPAVELGKRLANARLGAPGLQEEHAALSAFLAKEGRGGALQEF